MEGEVSYDENLPFNGVIAHIGGAVVEASSSTDPAKLKLLVSDEIGNNFWESEDQSDQFVQIDLGETRVSLSGYVLKSAPSTDYGLMPNSWIVAGSNDEDEWYLLDQVDNSSALSGCGIICYRECAEKESDDAFRFIRIQMTEPNDFGNFVFRLGRVEFYGAYGPVQ